MDIGYKRNVYMHIYYSESFNIFYILLLTDLFLKFCSIRINMPDRLCISYAISIYLLMFSI